MPLPAGTTLGPYELAALIGMGGMGEVYKARDSRLDRTVAVKVLGPRMVGAEALQRFEREARAASALNHPNILTIHDVGREGDILYFAMEWVEGRSLRDAVASGPLPLAQVLDLGRQIAEGLAKAHAAGVVHRDLKPENVMLSADGFAKIVDFGLAKLTEPDGADTDTRLQTTTPGMVMGSVGYMSPEQAAGRAVDYRADQFALGLVIYEMATGVRPFARPTAAQTMAATIEAEPEPITTRNPAVPASLAHVVARCLAKDPAGRYESTRDLAKDLKQIAEAPSRGLAPAPASRPARRAWPLGVAAALVVTIGVTAWIWWARSAPAGPAEADLPLVAVQAFRNLSADSSQEYFAAGMTEEIRGHLSKVAGLRLLSRSAVDAYAGADVARLARELGVGSLVEGTVRMDGTRVRIGATLIDAATQQTLWSEQYDRQLADIFEVQGDVALRIAQALQANLSPAERARLESRPTQNLEAYQQYLQARQHPWGSHENLLTTVNLFQKVLALDPSFASARAEMAYRMLFLANGDRSWLPRGIAEAEQAVRTDPNLAQAHSVLAALYSQQGSPAQARASYLRALELDPSHTGSMMNLSVHEALSGRLDESLHWARRAFRLSAKRGNDYYHMAIPIITLDPPLALDWMVEAERRAPPHPRVQHTLGLLELLEGRVAEGRARIDKAREQWPGIDELRIVQADAAYLAGDLAAAEALLEKLMERPELYYAVAVTVRLRYAYLLGRRGDTARAAPLLDEAERTARARFDGGDASPQTRVELAAAAMLRQDRTQALEWLERAYEAGYRDYFLLDPDPLFAPLAGDPLFRAVVARMRDDVGLQRERARERGLLDLQPLLPGHP